MPMSAPGSPLPNASVRDSVAGMRQPAISVVIPALNEEATLPLLFESLRGQTLQDFEAIVADSGSTDGTSEVVASFGARYVPGPRKGPAEGRNRGAREARADVLVFTDADCVLPPELLERILAALRDPGVIGGATLFRPSDGTLSTRVLFSLAAAFQKASAAWGFPHNAGFCFFFRRVAFQKLSGMREDLLLNETHDIALRSRALGQFVCLPVFVATSARRFRKHGFARTVMYEYIGSTLLYYVARRGPPPSLRPQPVR